MNSWRGRLPYRDLCITCQSLSVEDKCYKSEICYSVTNNIRLSLFMAELVLRVHAHVAHLCSSLFRGQGRIKATLTQLRRTQHSNFRPLIGFDALDARAAQHLVGPAGQSRCYQPLGYPIQRGMIFGICSVLRAHYGCH